MTQLANKDPGMIFAQIEFFIRLGNMDDLPPDRNFGAILNLGNALIEGDLDSVQEALSFYEDHSCLIFEHIRLLKRAFAHTGVTFHEPSVLNLESTPAKTIVISVVLTRNGKVVFISSDPTMTSYVQGLKRNYSGALTIEPLKEDPRLLLKQISRVIRLPDQTDPPPFSAPVAPGHSPEKFQAGRHNFTQL